MHQVCFMMAVLEVAHWVMHPAITSCHSSLLVVQLATWAIWIQLSRTPHKWTWTSMVDKDHLIHEVSNSLLVFFFLIVGLCGRVICCLCHMAEVSSSNCVHDETCKLFCGCGRFTIVVRLLCVSWKVNCSWSVMVFIYQYYLRNNIAKSDRCEIIVTFCKWVVRSQLL